MNSLKRGIVSVFIANMINMLISVLTNFVLPKYLSIDTYSYTMDQLLDLIGEGRLEDGKSMAALMAAKIRLEKAGRLLQWVRRQNKCLAGRPEASAH